MFYNSVSAFFDAEGDFDENLRDEYDFNDEPVL